MHVVVERSETHVVFRGEIGRMDTPDARPGALVRPEASVEVPAHVDMHPDLLALAAILTFSPWLGALTLNFAVSDAFAQSARRHLGIGVGPVDFDLEPRRRPAPGAPGLCYSGGADCTAALSVMPETTRCYFLDRVPPPGHDGGSLYRKDAAYHACDQLVARGRAVRRVPTDLEHTRKPIGFPHDFSNAVPAVLFADHDALDSIAWGGILESTYRVGALAFRDYVGSPWFVGLGPMFARVGLPVFNPVAGVSEVGTAMICLTSPFGSFSQSCMRGLVGAPCRNCWKCARKSILDASITGSWPSPEEIDALVSGPETAKFFAKEPLKHEGVVSYAAARYPRSGASEFMKLLRERVVRYETDHLARSYLPALGLVPEDYRVETRERLLNYLPEMSEQDWRILRSWDIRPLLASPERITATATFNAHVESLAAARSGGASRSPVPNA